MDIFSISLLANLGPYVIGALVGLLVSICVAYLKLRAVGHSAFIAEVTVKTLAFGPVAVVSAGFMSLFIWLPLYLALKYLLGLPFEGNGRVHFYGVIFVLVLTSHLIYFALKAARDSDEPEGRSKA